MGVTFDSLLVWLNFFLVLIFCFSIDLFILSINSLFFKSLKHEVQILKDKDNISAEYIKTLNSPIKEILIEKLNLEEKNIEDEVIQVSKKEENIEKEKEIEIVSNNIDIDKNKGKDISNNKTAKKIGFKNVSPQNKKKQLIDSENKKALKKSNTTKKKIEKNNGDIINLKENGSSKMIIDLSKQEGKAIKNNNSVNTNLIHNNGNNNNKKSPKPFGNIHFTKNKINKKVNGNDNSQKNSFSMNKDISERKLLK
jgi:hypothetical protein